MKKLIAAIILLSLSSTTYSNPPLYGQHDGYIRVNGHVLGLESYIADGYPNAVNDDVEGPKANCVANSSEQDEDSDQTEPKKPRREVAHEDNHGIDTVMTISQEDLEASIAAKKELEAQISTPDNTFIDGDDFFTTITTDPTPQCGYKLRGFTRREVQTICDAMDDIANDRPVRESARCHVSNCSTASYLAIIKIAKTRDDWNSIQSRFTCRSPWPAAYLKFVGPNGLRAFMAEYDLGESRRMQLGGNGAVKSQRLQENFAEGWPRKSDPILLQRDGSRGSTAHSVIFSHYETSGGEYDPANPQTITKVCYWSSNSGTNGAANRCENVSYMSFIDAAHVR